jgi:hypothetical protein
LKIQTFLDDYDDDDDDGGIEGENMEDPEQGGAITVLE